MGWAARLNTTPRTVRRTRPLSEKARRDAARATFSTAAWIRHAFGLDDPSVSDQAIGAMETGEPQVTRDLTITRVSADSEAA